jgi:hypothetical protein
MGGVLNLGTTASALTLSNSGAFVVLSYGGTTTQNGTLTNSTSAAQMAGLGFTLTPTNYVGGGYTYGSNTADYVLTTAVGNPGTYNATNLTNANVKSGVTFGVTGVGTYAGHGPLSSGVPIKPNKKPPKENAARIEIRIKVEK